MAGWLRRAAIHLTSRALPVASGIAISTLVALPAVSTAAAPPQIGAAWSFEVTATSARLKAEVNPEGAATSYHFEYLTEAAFEQNGETFTGALKAPPGSEPTAGSGSTVQTISQQLAGLAPETTYRYRILAHNVAGTAERSSAALTFTTEPIGGGALLADGRGWEMVSPVEENGGQVDGPGQISGGGVIQAAASGEAITFSSTASFGEGAEGAPVASQYIARRAPAGWSTEDITLPTVSGSYGDEPDGVPYQLFSGDLARGLVLNGERCRGPVEGECPVANPPLPGTGAPPGYQNYYLRDDETGGFTALLTESNSGPAVPPKAFDVSFAGAGPELRQVILSTCAALTPDAFEVKEGEGCDPAHPNLYEWGDGRLTQVNFTAGEILPAPPAVLAAQTGSISADGSRVYFNDPETGDLFLREIGDPIRSVAGSQGQAAVFQAAGTDGSVAFFSEGETLYRYATATHTAEQIATEVEGVLGASEDGSTIYYQTGSGLYRRQGGTVAEIASGSEAAEPGDYPPTTGTARVSADGTHVLFLSKQPLTGYDNTDQQGGRPDSEVFLWNTQGGGGGTLTCVSCNPTNERPIGPSSIPGAYGDGSQAAAGAGEIVTDSYKPRDLSEDGDRVFFNSGDALVPQDTDNRPDAYEWEGDGEGSCARGGGCLNLISGGRSPEGATFLDASASGSDAFFITDASLVRSDPGAIDLYDAREGGGFPEPTSPIACEADACQSIPPEPEDPTPGTLAQGSGQPPLHFAKASPRRHRHRPHRKNHRRSHRGHVAHRPGAHR
jgi:hypothetical protein